MARRLEASERNLHRYIIRRFKQRPKKWLDELRAQAACDDFARGELVKTISNDVRFAHASNFVRFFKRVTGETPQNAMFGILMSEKDNSRPKKVTDGRLR